MMNQLEQLTSRIKPIRLLLLDVDGVLTDGRIIIDDAGTETKNFNVKDGHWLRMLMGFGMEVIIITGRTSRVVEHRARDLGIVELYQGVRNKVAVFQELLKRKALLPEEVAFIGDDLIDAPLLRRVGFAATVADATEVVKDNVHYVARAGGGRGGVREICELIIRGQGKWQEVLDLYELA
ncbi:MAG: HAD-IIIA family hydrolase [Smithellaceae bacterium]|nr:HAD-IIIA family hydrolase [Smithellaceae bacterium]